MVSKKYVVIYLILAIVPIIVLGLLYPGLPDQIQMKSSGNPTSMYSGKFTLWLIVLLEFMVALAAIWSPTLSKKKKITISQSTAEKFYVWVMLYIDGLLVMFILEAKNIGNSEVLMVMTFIPLVIGIVTAQLNEKN